jgi:hypothetical protein
LDKTDDKPMTAGAWLRLQREAAEISLEALSVALKVRQDRLHALESDQLGDMPDGLFVRSLALGICRHLKADERGLLPLLPPTPPRDLRVGRNQIHSNPYNPNRWTGPMLFSPKRWPVKWYVGSGALAFGVLLWLVWPVTQDAGWPLALPTPSSAGSGDAVAGSPVTLAAPPVPVLETPPISLNGNAVPSTGNLSLEGHIGKPQPMAENVVITPVIPMALQQNHPHLPTQPTKP